jgi:hypothetical protein
VANPPSLRHLEEMMDERGTDRSFDRTSLGDQAEDSTDARVQGFS